MWRFDFVTPHLTLNDTDAIVLAGGSLERERFPNQPLDTARKAEIRVLGRPLDEWTVRALRATPEVERIVVVGDRSFATPTLRQLGASLVPEVTGIAANLRAGIEGVPGSKHVVAVSGDLPLLTQEAIADLDRNASAADVVFPYVEREDVLRAFPNREWMFARTREGAFTGSGVFLFRPAVVLEQWQWVEALLNARRRSVRVWRS